MTSFSCNLSRRGHLHCCHTDAHLPDQLCVFAACTDADVNIIISPAGVEWTDPSKSALFTTMIMIFDALGVMALPAVAYLFPNWRILHLVLFSPLLLIVVLTYRSVASPHCGELSLTVAVDVICFRIRLLPESACWLMTQGRKEEAQKELLRVARVNGRKISENLLREVSSIRLFWPLQILFKRPLLCFLFSLYVAGDAGSLEERKHVGHLQDSIFKKTNIHFGRYLVRIAIILHMPFIHLC